MTDRVYCDTSVFVEIMLGPSAVRYAECLAAIRASQRGSKIVVISPLVPAEVVGSPQVRGAAGAAPRRRRAADADGR